MIITVIDNDGKSYNSKDNLISVDDDRLPYYKGDKRKCTVKFINPSLDAAFAKGEIGDEYIYHLPSFETEYMELNV
jgi:hypothetical protein